MKKLFLNDQQLSIAIESLFKYKNIINSEKTTAKPDARESAEFRLAEIDQIILYLRNIMGDE